MKKILVCLITALFVFSGVCLAGLTALDTYRDTPQDPAAKAGAVNQAVDAAQAKADAAKSETSPGEAQPGRPGGTIGKYNVLSAKLDSTRGVVIARVKPLSGEAEKTVEIRVAKILTADEIKAQAKSKPVANPVLQSLVDEIINRANAPSLKDKIVVLEDNEFGIGGIGTGDLVSVGNCIFNNGIASVHELGESLGATDKSLVDRIITALDESGAMMTADDGTEMRAKAWYDLKVGNSKNAEVALHYALRALTRAAYGEHDRALTQAIRDRVNVYDGAKALNANSTGRHINIIGPREANLRMAKSVDKLRKYGATINGIETPANSLAEVRAAINGLPKAPAGTSVSTVVIANKEIADEIKAMSELPNELKGVTILTVEELRPSVEDGTIAGNVTDLAVAAALSIDELKEVPEPERQNSALGRSVTAMCKALNGGAEIAWADIVRLIPTSDPGERLRAIAALRFLPKAVAVTPNAAEEMMAQRSVSLSA